PLGYAMHVNKLTYDQTYSCLKEIENNEIEKYRIQFVNDIFAKFKFLFTNSRELPGPGVLYEKVAVTESIDRPDAVTELPGRTEYLFQVFSPETIDVSNTGHSAFVDLVKDNYKVPSYNSIYYSGPDILGLNVT